MADRTAAELFGTLFELIDEHVLEPRRTELALKFWRQQRQYDFSPYQMEIDGTLLRLGLARRGVDPDYPNDGEVMLYGPEGKS